MRRPCIKCGVERNIAYMQHAVFRGRIDEPVDIWKCQSNETCKNNRKSCPKCGHRQYKHGTEIKLSKVTVYECNEYAGMGDWCGCKEKF